MRYARGKAMYDTNDGNTMQELKKNDPEMYEIIKRHDFEIPLEDM